MNRRIAAFTLLLAICIPVASWAEKKEKEGNVRTLQGVVTDADSAVVSGAVVQLKDTKSLQVRSFITKEDGSYHFTGLNTNIDYEVQARHDNASSDTKTLSNFDQRKAPVLNLSLKRAK